MRGILAVSVMLAVLPGLVAPASAKTIGVVLMHGKTGSPNTIIDQLATVLEVEPAELLRVPPGMPGRTCCR
jgi:hypothetical protein